MAGALVFSGCTNNAIKAAAILSNGLTSPNPLAGAFSSSAGSALTISEILPSNTDPVNTFDLLGDGTGAMGTLCTSTAASGGTTTAGNNCNCEFSYIRASGANEDVRVPVI